MTAPTREEIDALGNISEYLKRFSDHGRFPHIEGPSAGESLEIAERIDKAIRALRDQREADARDAGRYRWLVENSYFAAPSRVQDGDIVLVHKMSASKVHPTMWREQTTEAIDAAMSAQGEK